VAAIDNDREAKAFVLAHHAFGTYPAARLRFGLYHRHECHLKDILAEIKG